MSNGNIKISEMTEHGKATGREYMPISFEKVSGGGYESFKMSVNTLNTYFGNSLKIDGADGLRGKSAIHDGELSYLERNIGQYNGYAAADNGNYGYVGTKLTVSLNEDWNNTECITNDGNVNSYDKYNYCVTNPINVKAGKVYVIYINKANYDANYSYPYNDASLFNEVTSNPRRFIPLSNHYNVEFNGGYGLPSNGAIVFYAVKDCQIVMCLSKYKGQGGGANATIKDVFSTIMADVKNDSTTMYEMTYSLFVEMCDRFIADGTEKSGVIANAISSLEARVHSLEQNIDNLGDASAQKIDSIEMPSICGSDLIRISYRKPRATATDTEPADLPQFPGQLWINTVDGTAYIATGGGDYSYWKVVSTTSI